MVCISFSAIGACREINDVSFYQFSCYNTGEVLQNGSNYKPFFSPPFWGVEVGVAWLSLMKELNGGQSKNVVQLDLFTINNTSSNETI